MKKKSKLQECVDHYKETGKALELHKFEGGNPLIMAMPSLSDFLEDKENDKPSPNSAD